MVALVRLNLKRIGAESLPDNAQWENRFRVKSASSGKKYTIAQNIKGRFWGCDCMGWIIHRKCRHLEAMSLPPHCKPFEVQIEGKK